MSGQVDQVVSVSIAAASAQPTLGNFGTPAFLQYHTHNTDRIRTYTSPPDLIADGFSVNEPAYLWATAVCAQDPHPPTFKIIRGSTSEPHIMQFPVMDTNVGDSVGFTLTDAAAAIHLVYVTVTTGESATQIATALAAIPVTGATLSASGTTVTATVTASGAIWYPSALQGVTYADNTASSSPGTDLDAALLVDQDWYAITGAVSSAADIAAVASWAAANKKTHYYTTSDTNNLTSGSGIGATLKTDGYTRSYGQFSLGNPSQYGASALESLEFTKDPGTYTDAYKQLVGVTADPLTATQRANLTANNLNYYVNIGGVNCTFDGRSASGQFMDLTRFLDALQNDIQVRVFGLIVNSDKVPYTGHGIAAIGSEISASLQSFVQSGALSNDPGFAPLVKLPDISTVSAANKAARQLNGVKFSCTYTDGIHSVGIAGNVGL